MYTFVIADDESIERTGMRKLMMENFSNLSIVGEVSDGQQAVEICLAKKPDILIIDIKMPILNGIEASRILKEKGSKTHVIISSAYSDYCYMNTAIVIGVDAYLLKPYSLEQFSEAVDIAIGKITVERTTLSSSSKLAGKLMDAIPVVESQFASLAIRGYLKRDEFSKLTNVIGKDFNKGLVIVFGVSSESLDELMDVQDALDIKIKEIAGYIYSEMNRSYEAIVSIISPVRIVVIVNSRNRDSFFALENAIQKTVDTIVKDVCTFHKERLLVGLGSPYNALQGIVASYKEALEMVKSSVTHEPGDQELLARTGLMHAEDEKHAYPSQDEKELLFSLKLKSFEGCHKHVQKIFQWIKEDCNERQSIDNAILYANSLVAIIQKQVAQIVSATSSLSIFRIHVYEIFQSPEDLDVLERSLLNSLKETLAHKEYSYEEKNQRIITRIEKFIGNHYYMDLSLVDMAESVMYSPPYFCKIFKELTGEGFVKYLTEVRLREANKLLEFSDLKINDIAFRIGYNNPNYFLRVYKKKYGITPSEYRAKVCS